MERNPLPWLLSHTTPLTIKLQMKRIILCTACVFFCFHVCLSQTVSPLYQDGKIWFKLKSSSTDNTRSSQSAQDRKAVAPGFTDKLSFLSNARTTYKIKEITKPFTQAAGSTALQQTYMLSFDDAGNVDNLIQTLLQSGQVEYAEKVPLDKICITPNDPSFSSQWHLSTINAEGAWNYFSTGSNTVIAIVDDAVSRTHPDLSPNLWVNPGEIPGNGIDDDNNGYIDDINGYDVASDDNNPNPPNPSFNHGTHVAGIAAAATNNNTGVASIGYSCKLMCIKASTSPTLITSGYDGIIYAANSGADIINLSWGSSVFSATAQNIINYAISKGCLIVAAAGNDNVNTAFYPAAYNGVLSVAATSSDDTKASFSNYGNWVDVSAPGDNIYSTLPGGNYGYFSGTSMAAPLVAGLAGLMKSLNPGMPAGDIVNCIQNTAVNINALNPSYSGSLGSGRIDAAAAMQCVSTTLSSPPITNFSANYTVVSAGGSVLFTDLSTYSPVTWSWTFTGGTPVSFNGKNPPPVTYNSPGVYAVSLTASNANGVDVETKTAYITVNAASSCNTINLPVPGSWVFQNYYVDNSTGNAVPGSLGWINGKNINQDKQKAMYFDVSATPSTYLTRVLIGFGMASTSTPSKIVPVNIYDGTSGTPGALLGTVSTTMQQIISDVNGSLYTELVFFDPVTLPASKRFFVSVDLTNLCWSGPCQDVISILSNQNGQTTPSLTWHQKNDNAWERYATGSSTSWNLNISLLIHPFVTNQPANATFTSSATTICEGDAVTFNATGSTHQDDLFWSIPGASPPEIQTDLNPTVFFPNSGTFPAVLYVVGGGCSDPDSLRADITVIPKPTVNVVVSKNPICEGESVTLTASGAATYSWTPAATLNASTGSVVTGTPVSSTTYTVQGTQAGCTNSTLIPIQVSRVIPAEVVLDASVNNIPPNTPVTFTATTTTGGTNPVFDFRVNGNSMQNGASAEYTTNTLANADVVTCNMISNDGCVTVTTASSNNIVMNVFVALPVTLDNFRGEKTHDGNLLQWETVVENSSQFFIIERSRDGVSFNEIGKVSAAGQSIVVKEYSFTDSNPFSGINYYRLRIVDTDGYTGYSYTISIKEGNQQILLNVWPNPAGITGTTKLQMTGNVTGKIVVKITDQAGRLLRVQTGVAANGLFQADIPVGTLHSGIYFISCFDEKNNRLGVTRMAVLR